MSPLLATVQSSLMAKHLIETQNKMYDDFHNLHVQTLIETSSIFLKLKDHKDLLLIPTAGLFKTEIS
jgi:hypothetical protein